MSESWLREARTRSELVRSSVMIRIGDRVAVGVAEVAGFAAVVRRVVRVGRRAVVVEETSAW